MSAWRRAAAACCAGPLLAATALPVAACELVLTEHRSARELLRMPLAAAAPGVTIAFEHSVLGTTVFDRYAFRPHAVLVEERFEGAGYGLPHSAGPGEKLVREGSGWRLELQRAVHPLVVRPLPAQNMRLLLANHTLRLAGLSEGGIELQAVGCN